MSTISKSTISYLRFLASDASSGSKEHTIGVVQHAKSLGLIFYDVRGECRLTVKGVEALAAA